MAITFKDFPVPQEPGWANASYPGHTKVPSTLRVFWDDSWAVGSRDALVFFSGGSGVNMQSVTSARVVHGVGLGYVYMDTISATENYYVGRNINFPNVDFAGAAFDIPQYLRVIYEVVLEDPVISKYFSAASKIAMLGHSRGAGALIQWAGMKSVGSPQMSTVHDGKIKGIILNSPGGSGAGGYPAIDRTIRGLTQDAERVTIPMIYTVGAGDVTHTSRAIMSHVKQFGFTRRSNIEFRVVGDMRFGHEYPTNTTDDIFKNFLNIGDEVLKR